MDSKQSDKIILKQIKQGDVSSYSVLVHRYRCMAYTLAISITKNKEDAEEVAQDAFVKAYKNLDSFQGKSKFSTWLYQIVYRTALSKVRLKKHQWQSIDEDVQGLVKFDEGQADVMEQQDRKQIVHEAISRLKGDDGFLLILYYYKELNIEELASLTGYSISNVKVKLHRARKKLHEQLQIMMNGHARFLMDI
ncbi:RNA polymerase sigma factor [Saccharicrinis fermentans]|uniref:RNA polymerase sigma factor n=1 Tax=Saccharicrinis fermentans DSM 9555 = JCM 21142 TaxID=869213 RepID=W7YB78_9BACT|nr:RNA polymerase sigma factor [Saccharicrinis fermentans]GAF05682.1 sigma-24 [Saccharicrinis fermentans DSM 9555 = JCM 21142]